MKHILIFGRMHQLLSMVSDQCRDAFCIDAATGLLPRDTLADVACFFFSADGRVSTVGRVAKAVNPVYKMTAWFLINRYGTNR